MSAQYMLHIYEGLTEDDIREFESSTFGSPYFNFQSGPYNAD